MVAGAPITGTLYIAVESVAVTVSWVVSVPVAVPVKVEAMLIVQEVEELVEGSVIGVVHVPPVIAKFAMVGTE
jgi:hypothetical protein